jgi:hypothetical protein
VAMPRPNPRLAPVTIAVVPARLVVALVMVVLAFGMDVS